jgi:protein required for attachment to host cells
MTKIAMPPKVWVVVGDGRKALVLRNEGDAAFPNLRKVDVFKDLDNPATSQIGSDRPGSTTQHSTGRHGGVEQTDWHDVAEHRFAHHVAEMLETHRRQGDFSALIVVAPPRTLADLRQSFSAALSAKIVGEVNKDLTKHPIHEIERLLTTGAAQA